MRLSQFLVFILSSLASLYPHTYRPQYRTTKSTIGLPTIPLVLLLTPAGWTSQERLIQSTYIFYPMGSDVLRCVCVCACVRACVRACVHACVRVCATWVNVDYPSLPQITRLPFQFPYYGHLVNTVAVTTGGMCKRLIITLEYLLCIRPHICSFMYCCIARPLIVRLRPLL